MQGDDDYYYDDADDSQARTAIVNLADIHGKKTARDRYLLVQMQGSQIGQVVALGGDKWRVGRHQDSELWLQDTGISRHHAQFVWEGDGYRIEDLESANGTYVQGERVTQRRLADGDVIQFGPGSVFRYSVADADQEAMLQQLYDASVTDGLTGAYNREYFDSRLASELSFARRHDTELSLLILDLDHFKQVNDTYGHQAGDAVLVALADALSADLRIEDVFARYGGEEFAIILRGIALDGAAFVAERFRAKVEQLEVKHDEQVIPIRASFGCASLACCSEPSAEQLIAVADRRLYLAKDGGRNRVVAQG